MPLRQWRRAQETLRVDSRTANSGAILRWMAETSRVASTPLMPSTTILTAIVPIASMGWRTVVKGGVYKPEAATSSKPTTEQCSGTRRPAFASARIAPNAVMSSNAINAVNGRLCLTNSSVNLYPASKLEIGSRDSGRSRINLESSSRSFSLAKFLTPRQRGALSAKVFGPRIKRFFYAQANKGVRRRYGRLIRCPRLRSLRSRSGARDRSSRWECCFSPDRQVHQYQRRASWREPRALPPGGRAAFPDSARTSRAHCGRRSEWGGKRPGTKNFQYRAEPECKKGRSYRKSSHRPCGFACCAKSAQIDWGGSRASLPPAQFASWWRRECNGQVGRC